MAVSRPSAAAPQLPGVVVGSPVRAERSRWTNAVILVGRFMRQKPLGAIGGVIVVSMLLMAVFAERIAPYGYDETIRGARMKPPSFTYWLGTDNLGRDLASRIVYGARVSVTVGFASILLATVLATAIGVTSGYFGGI